MRLQRNYVNWNSRGAGKFYIHFLSFFSFESILSFSSFLAGSCGLLGLVLTLFSLTTSPFVSAAGSSSMRSESFGDPIDHLKVSLLFSFISKSQLLFVFVDVIKAECHYFWSYHRIVLVPTRPSGVQFVVV